MKITDGEGSGRESGVTDRNELKTRARVTTQEDEAAREGRLYMIMSDVISLTTLGEQALLYFKNTSNSDSILVHRGFTGGTQSQVWRSYGDPTGGTIISDAFPAAVKNFNLQSGNTLSADTYRASADGKTRVGGDLIAVWMTGPGIPADIAGGIVVVGPGHSMVMTLDVTVAGDYHVALFVTQEDF